MNDPGRIVSLDILRGFALLGILTMNIGPIGMIEAAYFNPTAYGNNEGVNWIVWYLLAVFADMKFMAIFSMLFGASMLLIINKVQERGGRPFVVLTRRNLFLAAVGFAHGQFLWHGDVLWPYALSAFVVYLFRNRRPRVLIIAAGVLTVIGSGLMLTSGLTKDYWAEEQLQEQYEDWQPSAEAIAEEETAMRGSWSEQQHHRGPSATEMQTFIFVWYTFWRSAAMMLLGMALYKSGVLTALRSRRFYLWMAGLGLAIGLPLCHMRVQATVASGWDAMDAFFLYNQFNYWGAIAVALGYIGLVMLLCQSPVWGPRMRVLAPFGRMAFTNYLMQTVILTTLFLGHGFGLFGKLDRIEQMGVVALIWIAQIAASAWWLQHFRYGPAEWVWRLVTNLKVPASRVAGG